MYARGAYSRRSRVTERVIYPDFGTISEFVDVVELVISTKRSDSMHTGSGLHTQLCIDRGNLHTSTSAWVGLRTDRRLGTKWLRKIQGWCCILCKYAGERRGEDRHRV